MRYNFEAIDLSTLRSAVSASSAALAPLALRPLSWTWYVWAYLIVDRSQSGIAQIFIDLLQFLTGSACYIPRLNPYKKNLHQNVLCTCIKDFFHTSATCSWTWWKSIMHPRVFFVGSLGDVRWDAVFIFDSDISSLA